ncbi:hypothetical protein Lal_00019795 [Lupinus albus]|nr:hypothetical protein Lal_00019795 [Lupinus albus]
MSEGRRPKRIKTNVKRMRNVEVGGSSSAQVAEIMQGKILTTLQPSNATIITQPSINDLKLMFAIKEGIMVNCLAEIMKVMSDIASSSSRLLCYGIFISRVIDHLGIDTSDVETIVVNPIEHLVGDNWIYKMGIYKYCAKWMYQEDHNTIVDLDFASEEEGVDQGEQNPEQQHDEAPNMPPVPSFKMDHLDAMEQLLNKMINLILQ